MTQVPRLCLFLLLLAPALLGAAPGWADLSPLADTGAERAAVASPQDRSFLQLFLRAGLAAGEAGQLAARRGRHPGIRDLGLQLEAAFQGATRQLREVAAPLGLPPLPEEPDANQKAAGLRLQQAPGTHFDHEFLDLQLREQADLLQVLEIEAATGDNPAIKAFAAAQLEQLRDARRQTLALLAQLPAATTTGAPATP